MSTSLKIAITGASGLVGSALSAALTSGGNRVLPIVRSRPRDGEVYWSPPEGIIESEKLEGLDAVIHLAGEGIANGRWTTAKKQAIVTSRIGTSELLVATFRRLSAPPRVLLSASAVGYYGDRGDEVLTEESAPGKGFLAQTAEQWEGRCADAAELGVRAVQARFGIILDPRGGALGKMLFPFRCGLGGRLGNGAQWMSWIAIDDAVAALCHLLSSSGVSGPVNVCSPTPVTNREFTESLASVLHRPACFHLPRTVLRVVFGEMADAALLSSTRALPKRLEDSGFSWRYAELESALRHLLSHRKS